MEVRESIAMYALYGDDPIVVQKYGGTSVGTIERIQAVADRIGAQVGQGYNRLAVVVSAMSGETNRLVSLIEAMNANVSRKYYDLAVSAGEQVSVALLSAALEKIGVKACPLLGFQLGILTDNLHANARIRRIDSARVEKAWASQCIPVIAGFQGVTQEMDVTTLGRGGSDTSAVALACALKADFCEINTDVDGVFTADPRIVNRARLNQVLDFEVALEMASLGSKVLHSRCVELAAKYRMPLVVRNSFKDQERERTYIMALSENEALEAPLVSGVSAETNVGRVAINRMDKDPSLIAKIFAKLAGNAINVDVIVHNQSEDNATSRLGFTVHEKDIEQSVQLVEEMRRESGLSDITIETETGLAKISVVGLGMKSHHGVAARNFEVLTHAGIDIKMISTSEIKISCVIPGDMMEKAANALHEEFIG